MATHQKYNKLLSVSQSYIMLSDTENIVLVRQNGLTRVGILSDIVENNLIGVIYFEFVSRDVLHWYSLKNHRSPISLEVGSIHPYGKYISSKDEEGSWA